MVTVYSKPNCMQCNFTKKFLDENQVDYQVKDITEDDANLNAVKELGFASLPVVVAEGMEAFNGFRPDRLNQLV